MRHGETEGAWSVALCCSEACGALSESNPDPNPVAERRLSEFNPQNVANTAWAFATVNYRDENLFASLTIVAEWRIGSINPKSVTKTAWASATVSCLDEKLFADLAIAAQRRLGEFNPQAVANTAWASATVIYR